MPAGTRRSNRQFPELCSDNPFPAFSQFRSAIHTFCSCYTQKQAKFTSQRAAGISLPPWSLGMILFYSAKARHRKVTIWARVQVVPGAKVVAVVPLVTPWFTAQFTASEVTSVKAAAGALGLPA